MLQSVENNQLKYRRGFSYSTTAIIKLYTTTVILQFYLEESSGLFIFGFVKLFKVFEITFNDYTWLAERGKLYTFYFQGRKKVFCKSTFYARLKYYKTINESVTCNVPDIFLLEEHPQGTPRSLEGPSTLRKSNSTRALKALGHSGT